MKLNETSLIGLLPLFLKQDETALALCRAVQPLVSGIALNIPLAWVLPGVDRLPEAVLDALAAELHVEWYDYSASVDVKRTLIRGSDEMHRALGTPGAIERVARMYIGDAVVEEWWEYGAEPYHFRLCTGNVEEGTRQAELVVKIVNQIKSVRSVFDGLYLDTPIGATPIYAAAVMQYADIIYMDVEG